MVDLSKKVLCFLGFHKTKKTTKWTPSIDAPVVTEFEQSLSCVRCGKLIWHTHFRWDGDEMVDKG